MSKEDKAKEYADWLHKNVEEYYGRECNQKDMYYRNGDIQVAFEAGWDEALGSLWIRVEDKLPDVDISVLVLTSNKKVSMSKRYQPKDCKGNDVGLVCWSGSYAFVNSIVAWMPIPPFDEIFKQLKDR